MNKKPKDMTVAELIQHLKSFPQDASIRMWNYAELVEGRLSLQDIKLVANKLVLIE